MTNVESMDYTHSHPSIIASQYGTVHCPFSHQELVQTSPVHPNPVIWYALSQINLLISSSKQHHTYLLWHFHSHSEIYCHATFHHPVYHDTFIIVILLAWSFSWHSICGKAIVHNSFILVTLDLLHILVHRQRHPYRVILCSSIEL